MHHNPENLKTVMDVASLLTAFGAFFQMLPSIAALLSIIWTTLRIIEMITGKTISELFAGKKDKQA